MVYDPSLLVVSEDVLMLVIPLLRFLIVQAMLGGNSLCNTSGRPVCLVREAKPGFRKFQVARETLYNDLLIISQAALCG